MKKVHSLALLCIGLIATAAISTTASASAGNRPGALTISGAGGYQFFDSKRKIDNSSLGIFGLGWDFTENWGVSGILGGFNTKFKGSQHDDREIGGTVFAFDGVYHFTFNEIFQPYVLAGVGVYGMNPSRTDGNNEGNINAGVGTQLFIDKMVAFNVEGRDFYTWVGGKNDVMLDAGVNILFDFC